MTAQLKGLFRDTWWLWLAFVAVVTVLTLLVGRIYLVAYPMLVGVFIYFAYVRYDETGQEKEKV